MDTTAVIPSGASDMNMLMPILLGVVIMPLVQWIKRMAWTGETDPRLLSAALALICVIALKYLLNDPISIHDAIILAFAYVGGSTLMHGGWQKIKKTSGKDVTP